MKRPAVVPEWAAEAEMRRYGLDRPAVSAGDLGRVWSYACLTRHTDDIERICATLEGFWADLSEPLRMCGNGRLLREVLDRGAERPIDWQVLFGLTLPAVRPGW